jgi:hypothetical protein
MHYGTRAQMHAQPFQKISEGVIVRTGDLGKDELKSTHRRPADSFLKVDSYKLDKKFCYFIEPEGALPCP